MSWLMAEPSDPTELLARARAETTALIAALSSQFESIVESSALSAHDDEHDPEGQTIAFERAAVGDLLRGARADLAELDAAELRVRAGTYGVCGRCGGPIAGGRLVARPAARTCIDCANKERR